MLAARSDTSLAGNGSSLTTALAAELGRRIASGRLGAGDLLPTESEIQLEFGVSRTVVREAIRHLSSKGLVSVRPKVGTKVRPETDWNMLDGEVMRWHLLAETPRPFIEALYEMRLINEPAAARMAATRIGDEDRRALSAALEGMARHPRGSQELIDADLAFHRIVLQATGNPILRSLGAMIESSLSISFSLSWRQNPQEETVRQHALVHDAIVAGDDVLAEIYMRRLIESAFNDVILALYDEGGAASPEDDRSTPAA
ncbi:FadR/GntR family transcriptional regulator [Amorphus orientalis]|uniref:DNA-binding FadR family transcriptional regulator n=1 Tax=Amorphus orientalis TaxID=649198 RepID=A0AAE4AR28_9HYPH|nr:FadR/GntR family transcriptional regulator [Amorphus orientalis]MDQ0313768.1 DNA-binding FadR family transcriptional regulator [Amorphus orientalis]